MRLRLGILDDKIIKIMHCGARALALPVGLLRGSPPLNKGRDGFLSWSCVALSLSLSFLSRSQVAHVHCSCADALARAVLF